MSLKAKIAGCVFALVTLLLPFHVHAQGTRQTLSGHVRSAVSNGQASLVGSLPPTQRLQVTMVLPLRNRSELTSMLSRIYDPSSPDYHHFLRVDQFTQEFGPTDGDYQAVVDFAKASGFTVTSAPANRMIVSVSGSVDQIEKAFHVRMNVYQHPTENRTFYSPDREPSLDLAVPMAHIAGLNNFSVPRPLVKRVDADTSLKAMSAATVGSGPGGAYLGSDMRAAYYGGTALTGAGQTVGLVEFGGYLLGDVNKTFSSAGQSYTVPIKNVLLDEATGEPTSSSDVEEVLDIVQAIGMAPGLSQVRVYIGDLDTDILNAIASDDLAQQVSISWSWTPDDPATDDIFFMEFAAQGQSVFVASGDYGSFDPIWNNFYPGEDAFVTAVGGTDLTTDGAGGRWVAETAWTDSGGGVSPDGVTLPGWQSGVANSSNQASNTLRNVPDVAMEANFDNYACDMGACSAWGGTSFAAPRWAGFMALVNQQSAASGNANVGFFNPALYAIGKESGYGFDFHDIAVGNNNYGNDCCGWPYYEAVPGYDLVTGWGTPTGQDLIDALVPKTTPSFSILAAGDMVIYPGTFNADILQIIWHGGFDGPVQLAISGLPAGVTATADSPVRSSTGQYVSVIISANSSAEPGSYLLTVTGTSGSLRATASIALKVGTPFRIVPTPTEVTIQQGGSGASAIVVDGENSVSLAVTAGLPSGVTATWLANPGVEGTTLVLTASNSVPANTHARLTITGVYGGEIETTNISLVVNPMEPLLSISPTPTAIALGASYTSTVTLVPPGNYGGPLVLSAPGLPRGLTATFNPVSTSTTSTLTLTASSSATIGVGAVSIEGTTPSGLFTGNAFPLTITAKPEPAFALGASTPSLSIGLGASAQDTISINATGGFTGKVSLAVISGLPGGVTATFSPNPATGSSTATFTANNTAMVGTYSVEILGTSGSLQSTIFLFLTIAPPPAFSLSSSSASLTVKQGGSVSDTVAVTAGAGFSGNVSLSAVSLPPGVTASFGTNPTGGKSLLTFVTSNTTLPGNYMVMISGTCNGITATTVIPLNVQFAAPIPTSTTLTPVRTLGGGSAYTLTATVAPSSGSEAVPGNVIFHIGSATQIVPLSALNTATYQGTAQNAPGILTISADYQGSNDFSPSSSSVLTVAVAAATKMALSINPASSTVTGGSTYTVTAKVSAVGTSLIPTGNVRFEFGAAFPAVTVSLNSSGIATYMGAAPAKGLLEVEAFYEGQFQGPNLFAGNSSFLPIETILPASVTALSIAPTGALTAGSLYTLTAKVSAVGTSGTPTGYAVFHLGSSTIPANLNSSGIATVTGRAPFAAGRLPLTAVYQGSTDFAPSTSNELNETISTIPTTTSLAVSPTGSLIAGSSYTLSAKVSPTGSTAIPSGNVKFYIGSSTELVSLNASGSAVYRGVAPATAGTLPVAAIYQGTTEFSVSESGASNETIKAIPTTTALSVSPTGSLTAGSKYTLTAKVTATGSTAVPTGSVLFHIGSSTQTVVLGSSGTAIYTGAIPAGAGTISFSAVYKGTTEFATSSSNTVD